jgi:Flp pilus assembly protein TadB
MTTWVQAVVVTAVVVVAILLVVTVRAWWRARRRELMLNALREALDLRQLRKEGHSERTYPE